MQATQAQAQACDISSTPFWVRSILGPSLHLIAKQGPGPMQAKEQRLQTAKAQILSVSTQ